MVAENQQKHLGFTFSIKAPSFHSRTSIRAHKNVFRRDTVPILVSRTVKTRKFKLLYFRNETCYGNGNLCKDLFFVYLYLVYRRIHKTSLFLLYNLMTSLWKPSIGKKTLTKFKQAVYKLCLECDKNITRKDLWVYSLRAALKRRREITSIYAQFNSGVPFPIDS